MRNISLINGTYRPDDLIPVFLDFLEEQGDPTFKDKFFKDVTSDPCEWIDSLCNALDTYSDPVYYFGSHPGNGSDFGFWPVEEGI